MLHEEWILEAQITMGKIATLVRGGESDNELLARIAHLQTVAKYWAMWTASDTEGRRFALDIAEKEGVLL